MKNTLRKILCTVVTVLMLFTTVSAASYSTVYDISEDNEKGMTNEGIFFDGSAYQSDATNKRPLEAMVLDGKAVTSMPTISKNYRLENVFVTRTLTEDENFANVVYWDDDENAETLPVAAAGRMSFKINYISGYPLYFNLKDANGDSIASVAVPESEANIKINDVSLWSKTLNGSWQAGANQTVEVTLDYDKGRIFFKLFRDGNLRFNTENAKEGLNTANLKKFLADGTADAENGELGLPFSNKSPIAKIDIGPYPYDSSGGQYYVHAFNPYNNYLMFDDVTLYFTDTTMENEVSEGFKDTFDISDVSLFDYTQYTYDETKFWIHNKINDVVTYNAGGIKNTRFVKRFNAVTSGKLVIEFFFDTDPTATYPYPSHVINFYFYNGDTTIASMTGGGSPDISSFKFNDQTNAGEGKNLGYKVGYAGVKTAINLYRFVFDLDSNTYDAYVTDTTGVIHQLNAVKVPFVVNNKGIDRFVIDTWSTSNKNVRNLKVYTIDEKSGNPEFASAGIKVESASIAKGVLPINVGFIPEVASASLIVGLYGSDGAMKKVDIIKDELTLTENGWDLNKVDYTLPSECEIGDTLKVFVWDSESGLIPYCDGASISVVK